MPNLPNIVTLTTDFGTSGPYVAEIKGVVLGLAPGTPALQVEGTTFDAADRAVEFSRVIYRADRFRFTIESFHRQDRVFHLIGAG